MVWRDVATIVYRVPVPLRDIDLNGCEGDVHGCAAGPFFPLSGEQCAVTLRDVIDAREIFLPTQMRSAATLPSWSVVPLAVRNLVQGVTIRAYPSHP